MKKIIYRILTAFGMLVILAFALGVYFVRPFAQSYELPQISELNAQEYRAYLPEYRPLGLTLESKLPSYREALNVPSLSIAVGYQGDLIWAGVNGYKDLENKIAADLNTQYRIGSTSKALTATAAAKLYDQNLLGLDLPITNYLSVIPPQGEAITLRNLLSHQAGIRHYQAQFLPPFHESLSNKPYDTLDAAMEIFINDELLFTPGSDFSYSSYGINLASLVLQSASQINFLDYMQTAIFMPLEMTNTTVEIQGQNNANLTQFYEVRHFSDDTFAIAAKPVDNSNKWASGGFVSNPQDLVKLGNAWLSTSLFSSATQQTFFEPQRLLNGEMNPQNYALGWRASSANIAQINQGEQEIQFIHHGGVSTGGTTFLVLFPQYQLVIAASVNSNVDSSMTLAEVCFTVANLFINQ